MSAIEAAVAPQHPPSLQAEVIDVDALDDEELVYTGFRPGNTHRSTSNRLTLQEEGLTFIEYQPGASTHHRRSHPTSGAHAGPSSSRLSDPIIILESDDEDGTTSVRRSSRVSARTRARLFSPPPPPALRGLTPEVPPLPQHFAQHRSRPHRHHHHHHTPGIHIPPVIRASEQPLPFEANMESLPRLPPRGTAPVAAPRSHHLPSMGFGGALLSLNRQHAAEAQVREERDARSGFNLPTLSDFLRHIQGVGSRFTTPFMSWAYNESEHHHPPRQLSPLEDMEPWLDNFPSFGPMGDFRRRQLEREKPVHWKPEYTHPNPAGPGFSFDFAPPDNTIPAPPGIIDLVNDGPGPSSSAASPSSSAAAATVETTLVCARCLDPLVLAAPDGASEDVRKRTRVWALRCGHMLDGKCVAELMLPPPPAPAPSDAPCFDGGSASPLADKGKGKARADAPAPTVDRKGKRKAEAPLEPESSPKRPALGSAPEEEGPASPSMPGALPPPPSPPVMGGDDSIRARLRSRNRGLGAPAEETSQALVERLLQPRPPRRSGARGGGTGKGKGKGKGKAPRGPAIEAEHEWACPVMGCGRLHWSVRVQGEWRNDEGRGGIALFV